MKIRIFKRLVNGVFEVRIQTEEWSENDRELMVKYGEPEINLGGEFLDTSSSSSLDSSSGSASFVFDDIYVRIMSESPFMKKFDSRDYGAVDLAKTIAISWSAAIENRIVSAVETLRAKGNVFTTEEITEL